MMDVKKALDESDGDFEKAIEILRIKGAKDVGKRAERTTANGLVAADGGVLVELSCETDFVAKNEEFQQLAAQVVEGAKQVRPASEKELLDAAFESGTVGEAIAALSAKIGEKLELRRVVIFDGPVSTYLHRRSSDLPPAVGVLVEVTGGTEEPAREEGKPEQALPKIIEGRVNGFFKDVVLIDQPSVQESKKTVKAVLDEAGVTVTRFARFEVGQ